MLKLFLGFPVLLLWVSFSIFAPPFHTTLVLSFSRPLNDFYSLNYFAVKQGVDGIHQSPSWVSFVRLETSSLTTWFAKRTRQTANCLEGS